MLVVPDFTLTCAGDDSLTVDATFTPDFYNRTIVEQTDNPRIASITFHRINMQVR